MKLQTTALFSCSFAATLLLNIARGVPREMFLKICNISHEYTKHVCTCIHTRKKKEEKKGKENIQHVICVSITTTHA